MNKILHSKKIAIFLSYITIILQACSTIVLTNIYLNVLGADNYGLYQMIYSVAHYILILDLGISTTMIRFITEFNVKNDDKGKENFLFHFLCIVFFLVIVAFFIGLLINMNIENIYTNLTVEEYVISHKLFNIMIIQIIMTIICNFFVGLIIAYEKYFVSKLFEFINIILNVILVLIFLKFDFGIIGIAFASLCVMIFNFLCVFCYCIFNLKVKIKFHYLDIKMLKPVFILMFAMLLQSIIGHVNSSVDKTILGITSLKTDVAVYSIAATIVTMFNTLPTAVLSVFQTDATKLVMSKASTKKISEFIIKIGRFQFIITGGILVAFVLFGKDFIICWAGKDMQDAWIFALLIMIPNMIPLIQNVCLPILNAMDKRIFRSIILIFITLINIYLTFLFIKYFGPIGAPLATGISYLIGHVILMNIYYYKSIKFDVFFIFKGIFSKIFVTLLLTLIINIPFRFVFYNVSWLNLIAKGFIFCIIYILLLYKFGFNLEEKNYIKKIFKQV